LIGIGKKTHWFVSYKVNNTYQDRVVAIDAETHPKKIPDTIRKIVHPDTRPLPDENIKGQSSRDCVIISLSKLD